jgi:hypothetical protein
MKTTNDELIKRFEKIAKDVFEQTPKPKIIFPIPNSNFKQIDLDDFKIKMENALEMGFFTYEDEGYFNLYYYSVLNGMLNGENGEDFYKLFTENS